MKEKTIGETLRALREKAGLSVKDTVIRLQEHHHHISEKTLYSYEGDKRALSADMLLSLCRIYGCKNIMETFAHIEEDYDIPTDDEWGYIERIRDLDSHGLAVLEAVLNIEFMRCLEYPVEPSHGEDNQNSTILPFPLMPASAGTGQYLDSNEEGTLEVKDTPEALMADFVLRVSGDSMEPLYSNGDILLIQKQPELKTGDIGVFIVNNEGYIKRLGKEGLDSINPDYKGVHVGDNDSFRTVGKVLGKAEIV